MANVFNFQVLITRNGQDFININNLKQKIDFSFQIKRSTYSVEGNTITLKNFPYGTKLINSGMLQRLGNNNDEVFQIQLFCGYNQKMRLLCSGRVITFRSGNGPPMSFIIEFYETFFRAKGNLLPFDKLREEYHTVDFLRYYRPLEEIKVDILENIPWREALLKIYPDVKINTNSVNLSKITTIQNEHLGIILQNFISDTGIAWAFINNTLIVFDFFSLDPRLVNLKDPLFNQQVKGATLLTTNQFLYSFIQNPKQQINRVWQIENIFNPIFVFGDNVSFVDDYYNFKVGVITNLQYNLSPSIQRLVLQVVEPLSSQVLV